MMMIDRSSAKVRKRTAPVRYFLQAFAVMPDGVVSAVRWDEAAESMESDPETGMGREAENDGPQPSPAQMAEALMRQEPTPSELLDDGLEFVGSDRKNVHFFAAYFVRLPDGRVLSVDESDLPYGWQPYDLASGLTHCTPGGEGKDRTVVDGGPTFDQLAAALRRRVALRAARRGA
jgi:hypothetical protein